MLKDIKKILCKHNTKIKKLEECCKQNPGEILPLPKVIETTFYNTSKLENGEYSFGTIGKAKILDTPDFLEIEIDVNWPIESSNARGVLQLSVTHLEKDLLQFINRPIAQPIAIVSVDGVGTVDFSNTVTIVLTNKTLSDVTPVGNMLLFELYHTSTTRTLKGCFQTRFKIFK